MIAFSSSTPLASIFVIMLPQPPAGYPNTTVKEWRIDDGVSSDVKWRPLSVKCISSKGEVLQLQSAAGELMKRVQCQHGAAFCTIMQCRRPTDLVAKVLTMLSVVCVQDARKNSYRQRLHKGHRPAYYGRVRVASSIYAVLSWRRCR